MLLKLMTVHTACVLLGQLCLVGFRPVLSTIQTVQRNGPEDILELHKNIYRLIDHIHALSKKSQNNYTPNGGIVPDPYYFGNQMARSGVLPIPSDTNYTQYYSVLSSVYAVYGPLIQNRFVENLPKTFVCIMSGRSDCGLEAELTKTVSLDLVRPLLAFISSAMSPTCTGATDGSEPPSFLRSFFGTENTTVPDLHFFQEILITFLSYIPVSGDLKTTLIDLVDVTVAYVWDFMVAFVQTPMKYVQIALQFGIDIPSVDQSGHCQQGDLKQLLMWGMSHNMNWSLGYSLLDIFLVPVPVPDQSLCGYAAPDCQVPPPGFGRSFSAGVPLTCERQNLTHLNRTLCAHILAEALQSGPASSNSTSPTLVTFCRALDSLAGPERTEVWSNGCNLLRSLWSPLVSRSADCGPNPLPASAPLPQSSSPLRAARSASSLNQLACNYSSWSGGPLVDAAIVSMCSENDPSEFVKRVCPDVALLQRLGSDPKNDWLWSFCTNDSSPSALVGLMCRYDSWMSQASLPVEPTLVAMCWNYDRGRFEQLLCLDVGLFTLIMSDPSNSWLTADCSLLRPPPEANLNSLVEETCNYALWRDAAAVSADAVALCLRMDGQRFTAEVCGNATFLSALLTHTATSWLGEHCSTALGSAPTEPSMVFNLKWCDYGRWGEVDGSVVAMCWTFDPAGFSKNVCCDAVLLERLTVDPQNGWLNSVCVDGELKVLLPKVCRYSDWTQPIIVDSTDLALCAEFDSFNFTSKVCLDRAVLQNLLANLENTWLLQHCANTTAQGGVVGFKPAEQCVYANWTLGVPDEACLALCWDFDQARFVSSVCQDRALLSLLSPKPSSAWVGLLCATYNRNTTNTTTTTSSTQGPANGTGTATAPPEPAPQPCPAQELVTALNWTCSTDLSAACEAGASRAALLRTLLRCGAEALGPRLGGRLDAGSVTAAVRAVAEDAVTLAAVVLVALEESQVVGGLSVAQRVAPRVTEAVALYMERESDFEKKRVLLQCFGKVITGLSQSGRDVTSDSFSLIKEYFRIPLDRVKAVLSSVDVATVRQILIYYGSNKDTLQITDAYVSAMLSALLQTHLVMDASVFPDLAPMLPLASPAVIQALPPLQNLVIVTETINRVLPLISLDRRQAFGRWFGLAVGPLNVTNGGVSVIQDMGNLITCLPFQTFQNLSPAQLLDGLDVLQRNSLSSVQKQFVALSLISTYKNLTAQQFNRLGSLTCLAQPEDLLLYRQTDVFPVIQDNIRDCLLHGLPLPSNMITSLFLNNSELQSPWLLSATRLVELSHFLPWVGVDFLQRLNQSQLAASLPALGYVAFTPAQASILVEKISSTTSGSMSALGGLQALGTLVGGVKAETLWSMTPDTLLSSLPAMATVTPGLSPTQANAVANKLWGSAGVVGWLDKVQPLLPSTPLLCVMARMTLLLQNTSSKTQPWNTQQAKALFKERTKSVPKLSTTEFLALGTLGQGVSCKVLHQLFLAQPSSSSIARVLIFLRQQPGLLHTSLKKCVIEEVYQFEFFSSLLEAMGPQISLAMPVSLIRKFPVEDMATLMKMAVEEPRHFLLLPRTKQEQLVDKIIQRMDMYSGKFTQEEFLSLGVMATFVADQVFLQLDRGFFFERLELLKGLCYSASKRDMVASILQENSVFGPVSKWTLQVLAQVDRFVFFLPRDKLELLPPALMTQGRIERLFLAQRQWEQGEVGSLCRSGLNEAEEQTLFDRKQFVLQYFLGFLRPGLTSLVIVNPSCTMLQVTTPSAWPTDSLSGMSPDAFSTCLELLGQDPYLSPYSLSVLLKKTKQIHGPFSSLSPSLLSRVGRLASQLSLEELGSLRLANLSSISAMGAVSSWSSSQLSVLFSTILNSTRLTSSQLDSSYFVAMGYLVCGASEADMRAFNAVEFSKAVRWLGLLRLGCSEGQMQVLVGLLSHSLAFGLISTWGPEVFIEIGTLAVGLPDMAMSALVKEQIEGLSPLAISLVPAKTFYVVFPENKISMFSYEQGASVTTAQRSSLSDVQLTALAMVLTPSENRPVDFRGRESSGRMLGPSALWVLFGLLSILMTT